MMVKLVRLCCGFLLSVAVVINGELEELKDKIDGIVQRRENIHDLFRPLKYIDEGGFCVVYRGVRISDNMSIAMKFSPLELANEKEHKNEFEMYEFLHAINRTKVEQFGISPILYYNEWDDAYTLAVFSFFDGGRLQDRALEGQLACRRDDPAVINSLIMFRDFVRQSKYLHSCGIRHDDIKPENIMFRKHRSFLIDFNLSRKMKDRSIGGTIEFASRRNHLGEKMYALDDWESFLYTMCAVNDVQLEWFNDTIYENLHPMASFRLAGEIKQNITQAIHQIFETIESPPLKAVYFEFVQEVFRLPPDHVPRYDYLHNVINNQIRKVLQQNEVPMFTWLSDAEKREATQQLTDHPLPEISTIWVPDNFETFSYPNVRYKYFYRPSTIESVGKMEADDK